VLLVFEEGDACAPHQRIIPLRSVLLHLDQLDLLSTARGLTELLVEMKYDPPHHLVTVAVDLQSGLAVLGRPLQVDNAQVNLVRCLLLAISDGRGPQARVVLEHLETRANAEDELALLGRLERCGRLQPIVRLALSQPLTKVDDRVDEWIRLLLSFCCFSFLKLSI
jgi:hypothetical protein